MTLFVERYLFPKKPAKLPKSLVNLHRPLYIEKVDPKDYELISHIAKDWSDIAQKKIDMTAKTERPAWDQLQSCEAIARVMAVLAGCDLNVSDQIYVCKEVRSEKVYGIVLGSQVDQKIYGSLLVTHPNNIECKANRSEILRVKGVGTAFIKLAEEECKKQGKDLCFTPASSAEPFYRKFGYIKGKKSESDPTSKL